MKKRFFELLVFLALMPEVDAQLPIDQAVKSFQTADDVKVELVAGEPLVASPCALAFDEKGRMYVAENRGYPNTATPPQGTIALLEDTDGDGRMDRRTVFAEGLTFPNGVLPWRGGVIVTCAPDVLYLKDTDGDGRADERPVLLTGFDASKSTQLRVNAPTLGPDGLIYLAAGLAGGTITCPEHPERAPLKMTADVRFRPDTLEVENVDGKSQYGMSFDEFGRRFICMNRLPVQQVVLSSKLLARNPHLAFSETVQDCNERTVKTGLPGGGDGVRLFPISSNITTADSHAGSFSAACGIHIWRGTALGPGYQGCAFSCDPTGNLVHADKLELNGATFVAKPLLSGREFLASSDDWFRPVYLAAGPDGGLYVADMYRKVIEHPEYLPEEVRKRTDFESGKAMGRIWRLTLKSAPESHSVRDFARLGTEDLVSAIESEKGWEQATAARLLMERHEEGTGEALWAALQKPGAGGAHYRRVRSLAAFGGLDDVTLAALLQMRDVGILRAALELAPGRLPQGSAALQALLSRDDRTDDVWLKRLIALGGVEDWRVYAEFAEWGEMRGKDRWVRAAILSGVAGREEEFLEALYRQGKLQIATRFLADLRGLDETSIARKIFSETAARISGGGVDAEDRLLSVRLLARSNWDIAGAALTRCWGANPDEPTRAAICSSMVALDPARAAKFLLKERAWAHYSPAVREAVLNGLLARRTQLEPVLEAMEAGELPVAAFNTTRRLIFTKHAEAGVRDRAAKLFGAVEAGRTGALERAKGALSLSGKGAHGREIFRQACATCHRLDREGVAVGPDLLDIRNQPKENIVFHIVVPDAEIAPAFAAYTCETRDGRSFTGVLTSETPASITLRQPGGTEETVLRGEIKELTALAGSLMPTGLDAAMAPQDLADLLAFLKGEE